MSKLTVSEAKENFDHLINEVGRTNEPIVITGTEHNVILISEQEWSAIQETLYLCSIPGMRESIQEGLATPITDCNEELDW